MKKEEIYKMGDYIESSVKYERVNEYILDAHGHSGNSTRTWKEVNLKSSGRFMIVGIRTLSNGYVNWYEEVGNHFTCLENIKALLVVKTLHSKPFYIPVP